MHGAAMVGHLTGEGECAAASAGFADAAGPSAAAARGDVGDSVWLRAAAARAVHSRGALGRELLQVLRLAQEEVGWLPRALLAEVARLLGLPLAHVEGVAGFYRFLHLQPVGRYHVLWSDNITDRMLGNQALVREFCQRLWIEPGKVSPDGLVSTALTSCTGLADQGPAVLVNQRWALTRLDRDRVRQMTDLIQAQVAVADWPTAWFEVQDQIRRADVLLAAAPVSGQALQAAVLRGPAGVRAQVQASGLRGRGGAGFPTGRKWEAAAAAQPDAGHGRLIICNADEGEPGTFKDRVLLSTQAAALVEGMTLAAYAVGAQQGFIYLRGEYRFLLNGLDAELRRRREAGLLGRGILNVPGFDFDIAIHLGAGAYVCGEESALIDSLEGRRGHPRIRPPYPVQAGYLGQPTVVNNVETFCAATHVVLNGADHWRVRGTAASTGTKIHSVCGDCARPGIYEYPFGVSVEQILRDCGAQRVQAVQVGGPSGTCLAPHEFGRRLAYEDVPTTGSLMVLDDTRDLFELARNFAGFFAHESCGFCTPCRVGTTLAVRVMDRMAAGRGSRADLQTLVELDQVLRSSAHCGLGTTAGQAWRDTLAKFRPAYERHVRALDDRPGFRLESALAEARSLTRLAAGPEGAP